MADSHSSQDKTEQASPQKLRRARREGQVARSRELSVAGLLLLGGLAMHWFAPRFGHFFSTVMQQQFALAARASREPAQLPFLLGQLLWELVLTLLPLCLLLMLLLWLLGMLPGGMILVWKNLLPKGSRLNPIAGLGRMFSRQSALEALKSVLKLLLIGGVLLVTLRQGLPELLLLNRQPMAVALLQGLRLLARSFMLMGGLLMLLALLDAPFQRWSLLRRLRMTKQEVRDEHRQNEGRPEVKQRIRQLQSMLARARIEQRVPQADAVLVNPTHYAVAIRYDPHKADAPYVIAKGMDAMVQRIRDVAERHGKLVLSLPELTRAIYHSTRIDQEIPAGLYAAVAYVLSHVMQLQAYRQGRGQRPGPIPELQIPDDLRRRSRGKS